MGASVRLSCWVAASMLLFATNSPRMRFDEPTGDELRSRMRELITPETWQRLANLDHRCDFSLLRRDYYDPASAIRKLKRGWLSLFHDRWNDGVVPVSIFTQHLERDLPDVIARASLRWEPRSKPCRVRPVPAALWERVVALDDRCNVSFIRHCAFCDKTYQKQPDVRGWTVTFNRRGGQAFDQARMFSQDLPTELPALLDRVEKLWPSPIAVGCHDVSWARGSPAHP